MPKHTRQSKVATSGPQQGDGEPIEAAETPCLAVMDDNRRMVRLIGPGIDH